MGSPEAAKRLATAAQDDPVSLLQNKVAEITNDLAAALEGAGTGAEREGARGLKRKLADAAELVQQLPGIKRTAAEQLAEIARLEREDDALNEELREAGNRALAGVQRIQQVRARALSAVLVKENDQL